MCFWHQNGFNTQNSLCLSQCQWIHAPVTWCDPLMAIPLFCPAICCGCGHMQVRQLQSHSNKQQDQKTGRKQRVGMLNMQAAWPVQEHTKDIYFDLKCFSQTWDTSQVFIISLPDIFIVLTFSLNLNQKQTPSSVDRIKCWHVTSLQTTDTSNVFTIFICSPAHFPNPNQLNSTQNYL